MSDNLLINLLEALSTKNSKLLNECISNTTDQVKDILKDLPVAKCELLLSYLIKKLKNHKLQFYCMYWITALCETRTGLLLNNKKMIDLMSQLEVQNVDQNKLIGKLDLLII